MRTASKSHPSLLPPIAAPPITATFFRVLSVGGSACNGPHPCKILQVSFSRNDSDLISVDAIGKDANSCLAYSCASIVDQRLTNDTQQPNKNKRDRTSSNATLIVRFSGFSGEGVPLITVWFLSVSWQARWHPGALMRPPRNYVGATPSTHFPMGGFRSPFIGRLD